MIMIRERARQLRGLFEQLAISLDDSTAIEYPEMFPKWAPDVLYAKDFRIRYNELLYKVLQNHTSQSNWTPDIAPSLYVRVDNPQEEWPDWRQPTGSTDAYALGAKVSHNEKHWISSVDDNVWEPGVYGWDEAL